VLPYHRAANAKYTKLGLCYRGAPIAPPSQAQAAEVVQRLSDYGLAVNLTGS
jgi:hypothetical protein